MIVRQLALILLLLVSSAATAQDGDVAQISVDQLDAGLFRWIGQHPDQFPRGSVVNIRFPIADLYSGGKSIFHGDNSSENAAFIRGLPGSIAKAKTTSFRPSLQEALEMVPEFNKRKQELLSKGQYMLFVITYMNWPTCREQNEAVAELRKRAGKSGIHVIEVRLH